MNTLVLEAALLGGLILANSVLALAEFAVVSARRNRLQRLAGQGRRGAAIALELQAEPTRFLSTVQSGVTLIGIFTGFVGGAAIADDVASYLRAAGWFGAWAGGVSVVLVVGLTTYLSLVVGELVPKRLALQNAERLAVLVAPAMRLLGRVTAPAVKVLALSTDAVLWLLKARRSPREAVTEEEIHLLLAEGAAAGVLHAVEHEMVGNVFRLADRQVLEVMTPRADVLWLDVGRPVEELRAAALDSGATQFPVCHDGLDGVLGIASIVDLVRATDGPDLVRRLREPLFVGETTAAIKLPEMFRTFGAHVALVIDEHGGVQGVVSLGDVLRAIVGELSLDDAEDPAVVRRADGSLLVDGSLPIRELKELLGVASLPGEERRIYATAAGYVMFSLGRVPATGDAFTRDGVTFEVVDMDRHRIDKLLVVRPAGEGAGARGGGSH